MRKETETIFVGLSGGVDSSVAAKRLIERGKNVVGVFIKTWQPDFIQCNWEAERLDAMRVAAHLNIPFLTCDAEDAYKRDVVDYMVREYNEGRTPNPDVMCNRYVKFGAFIAFAEAHGAERVATGHYAQIRKSGGRYELLRGRDSGKDQSYFLWTLTQEQLAQIDFPVGDTPKSDIRKEAARTGLLTSAKKDSQGVCFLGEIDIKEFLSHFIKTEQGHILDSSGTAVGTHDGAMYYTIGQRHGFKIANADDNTAPHYVISKDIEQNTITVSTEPLYSTEKCIMLTDINVIADHLPDVCDAQFRYRQKPFKVRVHEVNNDRATLTVLDTNIEMPSVGQSCVLYDGQSCLGGGTISTTT
jgi:tRNA-uridine 2-sulfurtransferase